MKFKVYKTETNFSNRLAFLMKFIESPLQVGSITPSSKFLAEKMLKPIDWKKAQAVAELGAGTGVFTKRIYELKSPDCQVVVFEKDREMRAWLYSLYPAFEYFGDALKLSEKIQSIGISSLDAVVSGLPFALFKKSEREQLIDEVIRSLKPNGIFVTFQYSLQMRNLLLNKFSQVEILFVPLNLPPAFVYVCRK